MTMLAMPFLFIPDKIIHAWIGRGYSASTPVMILLGVVILIHAPIALFIQYLIARAQQKAIAITLLVTTGLNVVLSSCWRRPSASGASRSAPSSPISARSRSSLPRLVAPIAGVTAARLGRASARPLVTGALVAVPVLGLLGRAFPATTSGSSRLPGAALGRRLQRRALALRHRAVRPRPPSAASSSAAGRGRPGVLD